MKFVGTTLLTSYVAMTYWTSFMMLFIPLSLNEILMISTIVVLIFRIVYMMKLFSTLLLMY